ERFVGGIYTGKQCALILLQVAVIGERKSLNQRQHSRKPAEDRRGSSPDQFQRIRVLFLGHQAAARRVGIRELHKAESRRGVNDQVLSPAAKVNHDEGASEEKLRDEVPV